MHDLYEKSIAKLELPAVLAMLANEAVIDGTKERALALAPTDDLEDIRLLMREVTDAKRLMGLHGSPSFSGVQDMSLSIARADRGGSLNPTELLHVAALLRVSRAVKRYLEEESNVTTCIDHYFNALSPDRYLEERISTAIISEDEIADGASAELASIRRQMRIASSRVRETLNRYITSPTYSKSLQDAIITTRSGRYVVPVKVEHKGDIPGLVHDISSSGATLFVEPSQVVELNNEIRVLETKEKLEIERILAELSAAVSDHGEALRSDYSTLSALDLIFAKARLSYKLNAIEPELNENGAIDLKKARHPLLDPKKTVPIDIRLGRDFSALIITGPNTGGKTVSLKTLGLLTLMAECGLHIPVGDESRISTFGAVYADIGDEQSIEQSLSTFSSHMVNIVGILGEADGRSLVLFDELGAGTDPTEGAALAISVIEAIRARGARIAATTHYAELKAFALTTPGIENAACEFDIETLRPTYRLLIGVPGKSNAFAISQRLGLPEAIISRARELVDSESAKFEDLLSNLEARRLKMEEDERRAAQARREADERDRRAEALVREMEEERRKLTETAREEAARILEDARATAEKAFDEIRELRRKASSGAADNLSEARAAMRGAMNDAERRIGRTGGKRPKAPAPARALKAGDTVELLSVGTKATVITPPDRDGVMTLKAGIMTVKAKLAEVRLIEEKEIPPAVKYAAKTSTELKTMAAKTELDLRGQTAEEALLDLDKFIDNALLANLPSVTVIHGKGTGALRAAVHARLKQNKRVAAFRLGRYGEGEMGVTIVELK